MRYLKKFETNIEYNFDYKKVYDEYTEIDLSLFNEYYNDWKVYDKLDILSELVVGNIVTFYGRYEDNITYETIKTTIQEVEFHAGKNIYDFIVDMDSIIGNKLGSINIVGYYRVDNTVPIKIHTLETNFSKYNL